LPELLGMVPFYLSRTPSSTNVRVCIKDACTLRKKVVGHMEMRECRRD
jgi:hypothetical protein